MTEKPTWGKAPAKADHLAMASGEWFFVQEWFEPGCYRQIISRSDKRKGLKPQWGQFLFVPAEFQAFEPRPVKS